MANELQRRRELARMTKGELMELVIDHERTMTELAPDQSDGSAS